jgi:hypothetical protein
VQMLTGSPSHGLEFYHVRFLFTSISRATLHKIYTKTKGQQMGYNPNLHQGFGNMI